MSSRPDASRYRKKVGSHGVNRQRMQKRVQNENHAFLRRLQSVKPTISRTKMKEEARTPNADRKAQTDIHAARRVAKLGLLVTCDGVQYGFDLRTHHLHLVFVIVASGSSCPEACMKYCTVLLPCFLMIKIS